ARTFRQNALQQAIQVDGVLRNCFLARTPRWRGNGNIGISTVDDATFCLLALIAQAARRTVLGNMPGGRRDDERPKMRPVAGLVHADEDSHGAQYTELTRDVERLGSG